MKYYTPVQEQQFSPLTTQQDDRVIQKEQPLLSKQVEQLQEEHMMQE